MVGFEVGTTGQILKKHKYRCRYTILKSSMQALFRTVFRFEKFQIKVCFFLYFQCSKKEEVCKIIDIRRKNLTRFLNIIKCVWNYAAEISSSLKWDTLRAILMCFSMVIEVNEREVFRNRLGENANGGLYLL